MLTVYKSVGRFHRPGDPGRQASAGMTFSGWKSSKFHGGGSAADGLPDHGQPAGSGALKVRGCLWVG